MSGNSEQCRPAQGYIEGLFNVASLSGLQYRVPGCFFRIDDVAPPSTPFQYLSAGNFTAGNFQKGNFQQRNF